MGRRGPALPQPRPGGRPRFLPGRRALDAEMKTFEEAVETLAGRDRRYPADAYLFLREALSHAQAIHARPGHVSAMELLEGIRLHALREFGPMARWVLSEWGIHSCADFGNLVFNLIEEGHLSRRPEDCIEDFSPGFDFHEAFQAPFLPPPPPGPVTPGGPR